MEVILWLGFLGLIAYLGEHGANGLWLAMLAVIMVGNAVLFFL